ncbi:MAG: hypothetical protein QOJ15_10859, partial [Bradyrhizobium sp.]|nr:hypothetical protein [Bradyrhizobium sp.]
MNNAEFQLRGLGDPRLAVHATSALPAWLWSTDGTRILWANPVGAKLFGAANGAVLAKKMFGPADAHRRQVAQLAGQLPPTGAIRLERLRGFGATLGGLMTCACARLEFADGHPGILVVATEAVGRTMPLFERLQRLVEGIDAPIAAFARDGMFVSASDAARSLLGFDNLSEAGLDGARSDALTQGRVETPIGIGHMVLQRVASGADVGLVALIAPATGGAAPVADRVTPDYEQPALSGEAPAEFALIDAFTEPPAAAAVEHAVANVAPVVSDLHAAATPDTPDVERSDAQAALQTATSEIEDQWQEPSPQEPSPQEPSPQEPSPFVEAVADEPTPPPDAEPAAAIDASASPRVARPSVQMPAWLDGSAPHVRRQPLRFLWQMDAEGRFSLGSDEFTRLIGARTAAGFGRLWSEIAEVFGLDPDGRVLKAVATRETWTGITLHWPFDGGGRLPVELSGLPIYDRMRNFTGYRGFGVCRDLDGLARLTALRRYELFSDPPTPQALSAGIAESNTAEMPEPIAVETSHQTDLETSVDTPQDTSNETLRNVLPFRPLGETRSPVLTPVENSAFNELARQLAARLDHESGAATATPTPSQAAEAIAEPPAAPDAPEPVSEQPEWLIPPEPPARGEARRDKTLLDLLPVGVLIYRLDRLLYANGAFLQRIGYPSLAALEEAGGLDALYVEPGVSSASSTSDTGTPVTISAGRALPEQAPPAPTEARLYTISWDDDSALALIFSPAPPESPAITAAIAEAAPAPAPSAVGHANAEELGAILDTTAEGIVMFDAEGNLNSCNRSAEALFGYDGSELVQRNLADLFAPESQRMVMDYLETVKADGVASLLEHGRDVLGRVREGGLIPLSMTMGRTRPDGPNFFAVFRDLSQVRKSEGELQQARRLADRAAGAKADMLARISHEVRTPLNAIIGFAEVMIGERFGALGNERYI